MNKAQEAMDLVERVAKRGAAEIGTRGALQRYFDTVAALLVANVDDPKQKRQAAMDLAQAAAPVIALLVDLAAGG